ncbi:MAG: DUF1186 domain-containing protein [Saprospiraceae bacterium]
MSLSISLPTLNHPEVSAFYEYDLSIPREKVEAILALPRETLIQDMETLLLDTIERYEVFENYEDEDKWWEFPTHALYVLMEIKSKSSVPTILKLLEQDSDFTHHWFGDGITENFWHVFYHLGEDAFALLKAHVLRPGDWVNRIVPTSAMEQIGLYQPDKRAEIISWFDAVLTDFSVMEEGNPALDGEVIATIVSDLVSLRATELLPKIKALYDRGLVFNGIAGDYAYVAKIINRKSSPHDKYPIQQSIFDRYKEVMKWHGYRMKYDEAYKKKNTYTPSSSTSEKSPIIDLYEAKNKLDYGSIPILPETVKRVGKKVGRNEPCPCGSGKKYKKCCLKK